MIGRSFRTLAGFLSLAAIALSVAEGLWAATCAPMEDEAPSSMTSVASNQVASSPEGPGCPPSGHGPVGTEDGVPCPFTAAAPFGGCMSVATIAAALPLLPAPPPAIGNGVATAIHPDLLLDASLFHPPRS